MERRLAAILAADVAGYSRLMGEDEAGTLVALKSHLDELIEPKISECRGRIVKLMGDGVLAEFASAFAAVTCAIQIQEAMAARNEAVPQDRRIEFRMGINLGDVMVEGDDIYGDGVNVAARLEALAAPGGILLSGKVQEEVKNKLDVACEDLGEKAVKNIAKPLRVFRIRRPDRDTEALAERSTGPSVERPAVAVLPFENMSNDPEQEYFSDGLTEDIITALSHWRSFPVIARNSTFVYKARAVRVQEVARELGARYVLEGSVRKAGDRIRVTAQLVDAESGHHVWAEKFDRALTDVFQIQDEITQRIAAVVEPELAQAEARKAELKRPESLSAWDFYLRGIDLLEHQTCDGNKGAREMFERAIELDPTYGEAWAGLGWSHLRDIGDFCCQSKEESLAAGLEAAKKAIELDENSAVAHYVLGTAYVWLEQLPLGVAMVEKALALNPYHARANMALGNRLDLIGRTAEGIARMERSLELNPRDPSRADYMAYLSRAHVSTGDHETALKWIDKAYSLRPDNPDIQYRRAVCLAHLDRVEEARAVLESCERARPGFLADRAQWQPYSDSERNRRFFEGLVRNGLRDERPDQK